MVQCGLVTPPVLQRRAVHFKSQLKTAGVGAAVLHLALAATQVHLEEAAQSNTYSSRSSHSISMSTSSSDSLPGSVTVVWDRLRGTV